MGFVLYHMALEHVFLQGRRFFPVSMILQMLHTHLHSWFSYRKDKRSKPGILTEGGALSEIRHYCIDKFFGLVFIGLILLILMKVRPEL